MWQMAAISSFFWSLRLQAGAATSEGQVPVPHIKDSIVVSVDFVAFFWLGAAIDCS